MATKVNLDVSEKLNITCRKGDTFNLGLLMKDSSGDPIDVSRYAFLMQVKGDPDPVTGERPLIIGTAERGKLAAQGDDDFPTNFTFKAESDGNVTIQATSQVMGLIEPGSYVYDIQQTTPTEVTTTIFEGRFIVNDDVSNYDR